MRADVTPTETVIVLDASAPSKTDRVITPSDLTLSMGKNLLNPEILVLGDYIISKIKIPAAVTYYLRGGKVSDFTEVIPQLINFTPRSR